MSGGALDYFYGRVRDTAETLQRHSVTPAYTALYKHLYALSEVLYEVEWVLSGDRLSGKDEKMIEELLGESKILSSIEEELTKKIKDAEEYLSKIKAVQRHKK